MHKSVNWLQRSTFLFGKNIGIVTAKKFHTTLIKMSQESLMTESLPTGKTRTSVTTWVETIKIPDVKRGQIFEHENRYSIVSEWSVDDLATKKSAKIVKHYLLVKPADGSFETVLSAPESHVLEIPSVPVQSKLTCDSPSGRRKAVLVDSGTGTDVSENLQIWNGDILEKTYDLKELDSHKGVYASRAWGNTITWSPDEKSIAYLAEKKEPKSEPFFTSAARRKLDDPEGNDSKPRGREFDFRQSWGEQMENCYETVIVLLNTETDGFRTFTLPENGFPYDLQWVGNNSIVGVVLKDQIWRLGLIFCPNRESRIFQCDEHGFRYLSDPKRSALCPRVSPSRDYIIWQDREIYGPHNSSRNILTRALFPESTDANYDNEKNAPTVIFSSDGEKRQQNVPTVYYDFPKSCFTSDTSIFFLTSYNARNYLLRCQKHSDTFSLEIVENAPKDVQDILCSTKDFLLVSCSTSSKKPSLALLELRSGNLKRIDLTKSEPTYLPEPKVSIIPSESPSNELMPPSIYVEPTLTGESKVPLIVIPHGGPHGVLQDGFDHDTTYFLKLGFAVFKVNYVGSTGTWNDTTRELLGRAGERDTAQVHELVQMLLTSHTNIDSKNIFLCGGSHGGFITAHLSSQYPGFYKAAVVRNPVIDLNTMLGTTDIADWVYVEAGVPFDEEKLIIPAVLKTEDATKFRLASPINLVHRVTCPTLIQLGSKDLRVPMSQGLAYYRALKSHGKVAELNVYEDNHALSTTPVRANAKVNIAEFLNKWADKPIFKD